MTRIQSTSNKQKTRDHFQNLWTGVLTQFTLRAVQLVTRRR